MDKKQKGNLFERIYNRISTIKLRHLIITMYIIGVVIPMLYLSVYVCYSIERILKRYLLDRTLVVEVFADINDVFVVAIGITALLVILSAVLISNFLNKFDQRIATLKQEMHKAATGHFEITKQDNGRDEIGDLYDDLNTMIESIQALMSTVVEEQVQKEQLNSRQKDVEFKMLASQINPHFLYNTLETIRMKARMNHQPEIEDLVKMLAKIMRRNIQVGDNLVTFKSEIELIEYYLKIQDYRFGERIHYSIIINCDISHEKIMPLIIQPIVENAYVHGLESKEEENGYLTITIDKKDYFSIVVEDNGVGIPSEELDEIIVHLNDFAILDKRNIGLSNVNQRIKLRYGSDYGIQIESKENIGTKVTIRLPLDMNHQ